MEFFCQFLTPKGRGDVKETLLDKFDPNVTSLAYLVKVSVTRKLIDRSRQDSTKFVSIDALLEEYGDLIATAFNMVDNDTKIESYTPYKKLLQKYEELSDLEKNKCFAKLFDVNSPICQILTPKIRYYQEYPIQQVTDKTMVLYIPESFQCINFSLEDGHARGKYRPFKLQRLDFEPYQSGFERYLFEDYFNSLV